MDRDVTFKGSFSDIFMDAQYVLQPQELRQVDTDVRSVIYSKAVAQKFLPTRQIGKGMTKHRYYKAVAPSAPIFSQDFLPESMDKVPKEEFDVDLLGISKDYFISMRDIDASRNPKSAYDFETKIDTLHLREITALISDYKERILWRGEDIAAADISNIAGGLTGIFNDSNVQSAAGVLGLGSDDDLTAAGDGVQAVGYLADLLLNKYFEPPYVLVLTPGVYGRFMKNIDTTTNLSDMERILSLTTKDKTSLLSEIYVTPHLGKSTDELAMIAPRSPAGDPTIEIIESYPIWHYPINTTSLGIQGKILWMGAAAVKRPNGIAVSDDVTV